MSLEEITASYDKIMEYKAKLDELEVERDNFNNLEKRTLDEVVNSEFYNNDVWHPGWESEDPPWICKYECTVKEDGSTRYNILAKSKQDQDK